jgi:hypothetical protein
VRYEHWLDAELPIASKDLLAVFQDRSRMLLGSDIRTVEDVRSVVAGELRHRGWTMADGPRGRGGIVLASVDGFVIRADGFHRDASVGLWIETGRSWTNNGFLEHVVEAAVCPEVKGVVLAVRENYGSQPAFAKCSAFINAVLKSNRLPLPYSSLLLIGY